MTKYNKTCHPEFNPVTLNLFQGLIKYWMLKQVQHDDKCQGSTPCHFHGFTHAPVKFAYGKNLKRRYRYVPALCSTQTAWEHRLTLFSALCFRCLLIILKYFLYEDKRYKLLQLRNIQYILSDF